MPRIKKVVEPEATKHEVSKDVVSAIPETSSINPMVAYEWAINPIKLNRSIATLNAAKKINPELVVNDESIKAEYIKLGGAIR